MRDRSQAVRVNSNESASTVLKIRGSSRISPRPENFYRLCRCSPMYLCHQAVLTWYCEGSRSGPQIWSITGHASQSTDNSCISFYRLTAWERETNTPPTLYLTVDSAISHVSLQVYTGTVESRRTQAGEAIYSILTRSTMLTRIGIAFVDVQLAPRTCAVNGKMDAHLTSVVKRRRSLSFACLTRQINCLT